MDTNAQPGNRGQEMSDGILVQRAVRGDCDAFTSLVESYRPVLEGYVFQRCSDSHLASDVVQGVLLHLHRSLPTLHVDRSLKAWLVQVAFVFGQRLDEERCFPAIYPTTWSNTFRAMAPGQSVVLEVSCFQPHLPLGKSSQTPKQCTRRAALS